MHGYDFRENIRLRDQAATLSELLHYDTFYPDGSTILEAGCGIGAQTVTLARQNPETLITSVDISKSSLETAIIACESAGITNVRFQREDIFHLPFTPASFDHIFVCFVLEHLPHPLKALKILKKFLKEGGSITVIEGDHGSAYFHPDSEKARKAILCQVELQKRSGGNANIGRELHPLLNSAGFMKIQVSPRMVYVDATHPELVDGFTKKTFTAMIEGVREAALAEKMIDHDTFDEGIRDLYRTTENDGVFCYTFFKAVAVNCTPPD